MEQNKWTIYQDSYTTWAYFFPIAELEKRGIDYLFLFYNLLQIGKTTRFFILNSTKVYKEEELVVNFINYLNNWNKVNSLYPRINSAYASEQLITEKEEFFFSSNHWVYDKNGIIIEKEVSYKNIRNTLKNIKHPYNKISVIPLVSMIRGINMTKEKNIESYDFSFRLNSDLWSPLVPCLHCPRRFTNEEIRKYGWNIRHKYWHNNKELATLNVKSLNEFMKKMLQLTQEVGGHIEIDEENEYIYNNCILKTDGLYWT